MSDVTSFEVTGDWRHIVDDGMVDGDNLPDEVPLTGKVVFKPVYPTVATAGVPATAYTLGPVTALIADGILTDLQGRPGVMLAGKVGEHTVRWSAETSLRFQEQKVDYPRVTFDLTEDVRLTGIITQAGPSLTPIVVDPRIEALAGRLADVDQVVGDAEQIVSDASQSVIDAKTHADRAEGLAGAQDEHIAGTLEDPNSATHAAFKAVGNATYAWKRADMVSPLQFGAVGDGVADDTAAVQAAINACPTDGIVNGEGKHYLVGKVTYKSNARYNNARLTTKPGAAAWDCPVTIDGRTTPKQNLSFFQWLVDGNRIAQTTLTPVADGALSAWMILGHVRNIEIDSCEGNNAATDGLMIYTNLGASPQPQAGWGGIFQRIRVRNSTFKGNRRHGGSGDCCVDMLIEGSVFNGNGLDVPGYSTAGAKGAVTSGTLYGNGWDQEQYKNVAETLSDSATWRNCEMLGNAKSGLLVYLADLDATAPGYVKKGPYKVEGGSYDSGLIETKGIIFTPASARETQTPRHFSQVDIVGADVTGGITARSTDSFLLSGRQPKATGTYLGLLANVGSARVDLVDRTKRFDVAAAAPLYLDAGAQFIPATQFVPALGAPTLGVVNGRPAMIFPSGANSAASAIVNVPTDWSGYRITVLIAPVTATTGDVVVTGQEGDAATSITSAMTEAFRRIYASATAGQVQTAVLFADQAIATHTRAIRIGRQLSSDTLPGNLAFLGVSITKTR